MYACAFVFYWSVVPLHWSLFCPALVSVVTDVLVSMTDNCVLALSQRV
jgi:hypothetical protein